MRINYIICEKVRSFLSYAKLPKIILSDVVHKSVDIINISPAYALEMDILEHVLMEKNINYKHVKVFGCRAFTHYGKIKCPSLMVRLNHVSILETHKIILITDCGIQRMKRYSEAKISFSKRLDSQRY